MSGSYEQQQPEGWQTIRVGDLCRAVNGRAFKPSEWSSEGLPIIRIQNLKSNRAEFNYFGGEIDAKHLVRNGDLLFAWSGTPGTSFGAHIWNGGDAVLNQHIFNLHFDRRRVDAKFLCLSLNRNVVDYVAKAQGGVGLAHITKGKFDASTVSMPAIEEQRAVVAEIDKQFSRLDEAVASLQRVKGKLKRYRASVLTWAVTGQLSVTEANIALRGRGRHETAGQLLDRLLQERRNRWRGRFREPVGCDLPADARLPEGWVWTSLDSLAWDSGYGTSVKCSYEQTGVPVLRIPNVQNGTIGVDDLKFAPDSFEVGAGDEVAEGDMLVIRTNGSKSLIGRAALVSAQPPRRFGFASYLIRFRLVDSSLLPAWLAVVWSEQKMRAWLESRAATSAGQHNISQSVLATAPIPLPPFEEQRRIVAEVDRRLSIVRELEAEVDANLKRTQTLRQAVLAKAFSGVHA